MRRSDEASKAEDTWSSGAAGTDQQHCMDVRVGGGSERVRRVGDSTPLHRWTYGSR
jgi:hypothetical protein